jgi:hypothetical protein
MIPSLEIFETFYLRFSFQSRVLHAPSSLYHNMIETYTLLRSSVCDFHQSVYASSLTGQNVFLVSTSFSDTSICAFRSE